MRQPALNNLSPDELAAHLAQLEEQMESGQLTTDDETSAVLRNELETIASLIREPPPDSAYEHEEGCQLVTALVQQYGLDADLLDDPRGASESTAQASAGDAAPLGSVGVYELLAKIGEGGMGAVYKARHSKLDKIVAIKVLPSARMKDPGAVARFGREMRAVGKLEHPNIVRAMDAGEAGGMHFLVMEYVEGIDLSRLVRQHGALPIADACELIRQAAAGLEEAFDNGMVHRDIKPSNLILASRRRKPPVVKILDMGLALLAEAHTADNEGLTNTGQLMGTLDYMAPEQGGDSKNVDIRADIYALGATLYRLLCGEVIYHGEQYATPVQKMMALAVTPAPPIQSRRAGIPDALAAIVHRMLEKNPCDRFAAPQEVTSALEPFCQGANLQRLLEEMPVHAAAGLDTALSATELGASHSGVDTDVSNALAAAAPAVATAARAMPQQPVAVVPAKPLPAAERQRPSKVLFAAGLFGMVALVIAAIVFFLETPEGTLRVEINDPAVEVSIKGTDIVLRQADQEAITLTPGKKTLIVTRGDFTFETKQFELKKRETTTVSVQWLDGKVHVALADGESLKIVDAPPKIADVKPHIPASPATSNAETRPGVQFAGVKSYAELPLKLADAAAPITVEVWILNEETEWRCNLQTSDGVLHLMRMDGRWHWLTVNDGDRAAGIVADESLPAGRYSHVAATSQAGNLQLFVDGQPAKAQRVQRVMPRLLKMPSFIGYPFPNKWNRPTEPGGTIAGVRISTTKRYAAAFQPGATFTADADTLALYRCDELEGDVLHDASTHGSHGTLTGAKWIQPPDALSDQQVTAAQWLLDNKKLRTIGFAVDGRVQGMSTLPSEKVLVRELNFHWANNAGKLTEEDIPKLAVFTELESLNLGRQPLTDAGLARLTPLRKLKVLSVVETGITPAAAKTLREFPQLEFFHGPSSDEWLKALAGHPTLRALYFHRAELSTEAVGWFSEYPQLRELRFVASGLWPPEKLALLKECRQLTKLEVSYTPLDDTSVEIFRGIPTLIELNVMGTKLSAEGVQQIAASLPQCTIRWEGGVLEPMDKTAMMSEWLLANEKLLRIDFEIAGEVHNRSLVPPWTFTVRKLDFSTPNNGGNLQPEEIARLTAFVELEWLNLSRQPVSDEALAALTPLKKLKWLCIADTLVTPAAAPTLRAFPELEYLHGPADASWLKALAGHPTLKTLHFYRNPMTPETLALFKEYPQLTELHFVECGAWPNENIALLRDCPHLTKLELSHSPVGDRNLEALSGLAKLTELNLMETEFTEAGIQKLAQALPRCRITWNDGVKEPTISDEQP